MSDPDGVMKDFVFMKRNIVFRGKRKDNNKWIYGSLLVEYDGTCRISWWEDVLLETENNYREPVNFCEEVHKETVGQYTELNDTRNPLVQIFEGDIVRCYDSSAKDISWGLDKVHAGIIEYTPDCYSLKVPGKLISDTGAVKQWERDVYLPDWSNAENIEVCGNIHDNPELIASL